MIRARGAAAGGDAAAGAGGGDLAGTRAAAAGGPEAAATAQADREEGREEAAAAQGLGTAGRTEQARTAAAPMPGASVDPPSATLPTWKGLLLRHLEKHKRYPSESQRARHEGVTYVRFTMSRDGRVIAMRAGAGLGLRGAGPGRTRPAAARAAAAAAAAGSAGREPRRSSSPYSSSSRGEGAGAAGKNSPVERGVRLTEQRQAHRDGSAGGRDRPSLQPSRSISPRLGRTPDRRRHGLIARWNSLGDGGLATARTSLRDGKARYECKR